MIVLMASGNAAVVSGSLTDSIRTFSATIAAEMAEVVFGSPHYNVLFFIGTLLRSRIFKAPMDYRFGCRALRDGLQRCSAKRTHRFGSNIIAYRNGHIKKNALEIPGIFGTIA
jgi:hypothetical protein